MRCFVLALIVAVLARAAVLAQPVQPAKVESPTVKVLTGLTVPEFEQEMQQFVVAMGISCGGCHMARGDFASDSNPRKVKARQMIEMTKALNSQFFPAHKRAERRIDLRACDLLHLPPRGTPAKTCAVTSAGCAVPSAELVPSAWFRSS